MLFGINLVSLGPTSRSELRFSNRKPSMAQQIPVRKPTDRIFAFNVIANAVYSAMESATLVLIKRDVHYMVIHSVSVWPDDRVFTISEILEDEIALKNIFLWIVNDYSDAAAELGYVW